jgi:transcriptional regulator with XRE-family HTH domain
MTPRGRALAATLRRLREDAKIGSRDLSTRLGLSHSTVSHWEHGRRIPTTEDIAALLAVLNVVGAERERVLDLTRRANEPNWLTVGLRGMPQQLAGAIESERAASAITEWAHVFIPGLLQTAEYVKAMMSTGTLAYHEIETRTVIRLSRREVITREPFPVNLLALIGDAALHEPVGGPQVMAEQLRFLAEFAQRPNITVRIVPSRIGWHPGFAGPFILYDFPDAAAMVYFEHHSSGAFVPDKDDVAAYREAIDTISGIALGPEESRLRIEQVATEWERAE